MSRKTACKDVIMLKSGTGVRGIVPQMIRKNSTQDKLRLFFRVDRVYQDKSIILRQGDNIIYKHKKRKMAPGEMEQVTLSRNVIESLDLKNDLTISVE